MATRPSLKIEGLKALRDTLRKRAPEAADKAATDTVGEIADLVERRIFRRLQNFGRTGRLAHSLIVRKRLKPRDGIVSAEVRGGATAPYMLINEFGTVRTPAQPAITPSVEETRPELPALYKQFFFEALARRLKRGR